MNAKDRLLLCAACFVLCGADPLAAQQAAERPDCWAPLDRPSAKTTGMLSCASASCHGQSTDDAFPAGTARQEATLWLEHDPHAQAARTLNSLQFKRILALVSSGREGGPPSAEIYLRCARCHDPQGLALAGKDAAELMTMPASVRTRGISCETCHGAAEKWLTEHYRGDVSRAELSELGMTDTGDVLVRGRRCAACHVGDETRDMNHDMIAAGHPPLRFELSAYHDLIRRKHWSDAERIERPHFKAQLWAAGQLAVTDATVTLLQSRGERNWPELAEFDCLACHQRLRPVTSPKRQRGTRELSLGTSAWQPWNLALTSRLIEAEIPATLSLQSSPTDAVRQATLLRTTLREHPLAHALSRAGDATSPAFTTDDLLRLIDEPAAGGRATWAAACHELLALKAAYLSWRDERRIVSHDPWSVAFRRDLDDLTAALRFGSTEFEWPAFDWDGLPPAQRKTRPAYNNLAEIQDKLRELARQLRQQIENPGPTGTIFSTQP